MGFHCGVSFYYGAQTLGVWASVVAVHGLSCSVACGIVPDRGWSPYLLHWQVDSCPLYHQGSPPILILNPFPSWSALGQGDQLGLLGGNLRGWKSRLTVVHRLTMDIARWP